MDKTSSISNTPTLGEFDQMTKRWATTLYKLMALGFVSLGVAWVACALWATYRVSDVKGSLFEDHFTAMITTCWVGLYAVLLSVLLSLGGYTGWGIAYYGNALLVVSVITVGYRLVYGVKRLSQDSGFKQYRERR